MQHSLRACYEGQILSDKFRSLTPARLKRSNEFCAARVFASAEYRRSRLKYIRVCSDTQSSNIIHEKDTKSLVTGKYFKHFIKANALILRIELVKRLATLYGSFCPGTLMEEDQITFSSSENIDV